MNKKFLVALILPLLLIPLASFAYAHNYDYVEKKYKLHVGTMFANITYFHVDYVKCMDQDNNGILFGDEVNITVFEDDCTWKVHIMVDPVSGGFVLNTTMEITNVGDLPYTVTWITGRPSPYPSHYPIWDNSTDDECWDYMEDPKSVPPMYPRELWSWDIKYYKDNSTKTGGDVYPATPTEHKYKPGDVFRVVQHIDLRQPSTDLEAKLYKEIMGSWFYIHEIFTFASEDLIETSSWTFGQPYDD